MIERVVVCLVEYLANALWQLPLLALGAWWLLRVVRPGPLAQHRVWVVLLGLGVLLPLAKVAPEAVSVRAVAGDARGVESDGGGYLPMAKASREGDEGVRLSWVREALRRRSVDVSAGVGRGLAAMYVVLMLLGGLRLVRAWSAARRLVAEAEDVPLDDGLGTLLAECGQRVGVDVPRTVTSGEVSSPAVVGRVLVLPEGFAGYSEDEMRAALLHELAHLRRGDYAMNVVCEAMGLPVVWHPVSYAVRRRIRSTREMVCDAIAADAMGSTRAYALSLLELAAKACVGGVEAQPMAVGLFTNNNLEERVMRLMKTEQTMDVRATVVRWMSAAGGMVAVVALAAMVHVTPARAQAASSPTQQAASSEAQQRVPAAPVVPTIAGAPGGPALPVAPVVPTLPPAPRAPASTPAAAPAPTAAPAPAPFAGRQDEGRARDEPLAMAHGTNSTIEADEGTYLHGWKGADGQPFQVLTRDKAEPTATQKQQYEEMFRRQTMDMEKELAAFAKNRPDFKRQMADAQRQAAEARKLMQSGEIERQMAEVHSPEFRKQMAEQIASAKVQVEMSKEEQLEVMKQMREINGAEMQKSMAELRRQMADARLNGLNPRTKVRQMDSAEMKRQMAEVDRELKKFNGKELQKQLEEEMKDVRKQLEETRKSLEGDGQKVKAEPDSNCNENCATTPQ
jgi:beta-lactamase regulating signal transducer with metallopeptidase domain